MKNLIALSQWAIIREIFLLRYKALLHQKLKWKKPRFTYNFYFPVNFSIRNVSPEIENIMWLKTYTNFVSEYISISWSTCSFPAFISEFDTNHIFRVLSIPSDPFQEFLRLSIYLNTHRVTHSKVQCSELAYRHLGINCWISYRLNYALWSSLFLLCRDCWIVHRKAIPTFKKSLCKFD